MRASEKDVDKLGQRFTKLGKEINDSLKDSSLKGWAKFKSEGVAAASLITGTFDSLGQTLGSVIGTAILPGIGTAIGSTIGSGVDTAISKVSGVLVPVIKQGIELNKQLELTRIEFTTFAGSEQEADKYLAKLKQHAKDTGYDFMWVLDTSEHVYDLTNNLKLTDVILRAATDQAADFGGKAETIEKVADALGLIAEKGSLAGRELQKLYKLGINAKKYLAEATGLTEKQIQKLMDEDRLRGDVAARLIAEGIERDKGGFAAKRASTTTAGAERKFAVNTQLLAAEGTENATKAIGDFYRSGNRVLESEGAKQFTEFIDQTTGSLINLVEKGLSTGIDVTKGLAEGIVSGDALKAVGSAVTTLGDWVQGQLEDAFVIRSPSKRMNLSVGVPIGMGIAQGITDGFVASFGKTKEEIVAELEKLLEDPRVKAFLAAIEKAEGAAPNIIVGGKRFSDLSRHPNVVGLRTEKGPSTAAGSYQITGSNWYGRKGHEGLKDLLGLPDFSAHSQDLAALYLLLDTPGAAEGLKALLSGDPSKLMAVSAKNWTSSPGSTIGGGKQRTPGEWLGYYNQALAGLTTGNQAGAGAATAAVAVANSSANPIPVSVVGWNVSGAGAAAATAAVANAARLTGQRPQDQEGAGAAAATVAVANAMSGYVMQLGEEDAATVDVIARKEQLIETDKRSDFEMRKLINTSTSVPGALTPLIGAEQQHADTAIELTKKYQEAARKEVVIGVSLLNKLSGAIGQISGFMPQQQVGKKRGFWSKVLGVAAPFLSFIPGVGPILSQVAGMASSALAGEWSGVVTGLAGGLQSGGAFRRRPSDPVSTALPATVGAGGLQIAPGVTLFAPPHRAVGGPGIRGHVYWTGERGPEPFIAPANGHFLSHHDAMRALAGSNNGSDNGGEFLSVLRELRSEIGRLRSMPPGNVVTAGAHGLLEAMDRDAGLIRLISRRQRLP